MYVVTGATGSVGSKLVPLLNPKENKVRVIARREEGLKKLADIGAEPYIGSLEDTEKLLDVFDRAKVVFTMIPPNLQAKDVRKYQNNIGESLATAIKAARVKYVVNLSSVGAHLKDVVGIVNGLYDQEQRLNTLEETNVLHLRPTFFMENSFRYIDLIKTKGIIAGSIRGDLSLPYIAIQDVAKTAAEAILSLNFEGHEARELLGPRDYTMYEFTEILGKAIGKPDIPYIQVPYEDFKQNLKFMGVTDSVSTAMIEFIAAFNEGIAIPAEERSPRNTTSTTLEKFSKLFAEVYNA